MAQNSLSWEKSSQSLEVNWDVWILTTAPCSHESGEGVSQTQGLGREGRGDGGVPGSCLIAVLFAPSGGAEVFCSVRLHIILWQAAVQRWRSYQARGGRVLPAPPSSFCNTLSNFVVSVSTCLPRSDWQSLLFTGAQASARPWGAVSPTPLASLVSMFLLFHCGFQIPSVGIMTTINSILTNVIKLILRSMRGLFLNSSWYA